MSTSTTTNVAAEIVQPATPTLRLTAALTDNLADERIKQVHADVLRLRSEPASTSRTKENLKPVLLSQVIDLTAAEERAICEMFSRWALDNEINLFELWGLDLFGALEKLAHQCTTDHLERYINLFASVFVCAYFTQCTLNTKELIANARITWESNNDFLLSPEILCDTLRKINKILKAIKLSKYISDDDVNNSISLVQEKIRLGVKLWTELQRKEILRPLCIEQNLINYAGSNALNREDDKKTLKSLTALTRFLCCGITEANRKRMFGYKVTIFAEYQRQLTHFSANKRDLTLLREIKKIFIVGLMFNYNSRQKCGTDFVKALKGKQARIVTNGMSIPRVDYINQSFALLAQTNFVERVTENLQRIFDNRVVSFLAPDDFISQDLYIRRLLLNGEHLLRKFSSTAEPTESPAKILLSEYAPFIKENVFSLDSFFIVYQQAYKHLEQYFDKGVKEVLDAVAHSRPQRRIWVCISTYFQRAIKELHAKVLPDLETCRKDNLLTAKEHLLRLPFAELESNRADLIDKLQKLTFNTGLDFCRLVMFLTDLESFINPFLVDDELHIIPIELANYMMLDGIEGVFDEVLSELSPPPTAATASAAHAQQKIITETAPANVSTRKEREISRDECQALEKLQKNTPESPFKIEHGEKIRVVLQKLKALGFIPTRTRGSHVILRNSDGRQTVVPVNQDHLAPGTAASIQRQVTG